MRADLTRSKIDKISVYAKEEAVKKAAGILHGGNAPMTGWVELPRVFGEEDIERIISVSRALRETSQAIVLIGIGGSYLGAKAAYEMIKDGETDEGEPQILFAGWNMSASYHNSLIKQLENKDFSIIVVSKSGSTTETRAAYLLFTALLKKKYKKNFASRVVVISEENSPLYEEGRANGFTLFEMDKNVGGRYSVLSAAGLVPLSAFGIDIRKVLEGAKKSYRDNLSDDIRGNSCYQYAVTRRLIVERFSRDTEIFCFYEPRMEFFGSWLVQLFGESEGKDHSGVYPTQLLFTRDLHSMGQFLQDGSRIFFETVIKIKNAGRELRFEHESPGYSEYNEIISRAVTAAHRESPIVTLTLNDFSEESFGYAVYFFEKACAVSCLLAGVDPFNQPGVEVYKEKVRALTAEYREQNK